MVNDISELHCNNAGLILCHPFLIELFKTNDYLDVRHCFKNTDNQIRAVLLLNFMANGKDYNLNSLDLIIQKLLCGMPINHTLPDHITLSTTEKKSALELLEALIGHWKSLKQSNINVLRDQFLRRPGLLRFNNTCELAIQNNTIDILLDNVPWDINRITLPWLPKMILVTWR
ncbi:contractile injection system tape measure protein [uncultured Psychroserpens sp.]|uniref:contractile injection system tape measure protein n=1 Tax=uncultured Psychroserpens sp. TaxID=255436 RepID=UPI0026332BDA|nr:contractile injection system tape measure protein [uncultured Psychroserpens sp.]